VTDGPYRSPAIDRLGATVRLFVVPRRSRYLGSARVARPRFLSFGNLAAPTTTTAVPSARMARAEAVEVCERGLRVRGRHGVLELTWDQIARWDAEVVDGEVVAIDLAGSHGERLRLGGVLRDKTELHALVSARLNRR
jgi:hypothetical protein